MTRRDASWIALALGLAAAAWVALRPWPGSGDRGQAPTEPGPASSRPASVLPSAPAPPHVAPASAIAPTAGPAAAPPASTLSEGPTDGPAAAPTRTGSDGPPAARPSSGSRSIAEVLAEGPARFLPNYHPCHITVPRDGPPLLAAGTSDDPSRPEAPVTDQDLRSALSSLAVEVGLGAVTEEAAPAVDQAVREYLVTVAKPAASDGGASRRAAREKAIRELRRLCPQPTVGPPASQE